jgi:hypothetical protein
LLAGFGISRGDIHFCPVGDEALGDTPTNAFCPACNQDDLALNIKESCGVHYAKCEPFYKKRFKEEMERLSAALRSM